ncbi:MAG: hypothetical protein KIS76_02880 [Pyrinomonadaceae bacterium]|nr:hypothetical protein [Pyrinomonadaceae bacterium]
MAETVIEKNKKQKYPYGISPEVRKAARERLERIIKEQGVKVAKTSEDLYRHSDKSGQTQEEIQAEVDEFLRMREEWREEDRKLKREREL